MLNQISENLQKGKAKLVKQQVQEAIDAGIPAQDILEQGLIAGMNIVGEKFHNNEVFVPEVLVAARAMNMGAALLKPLLAADGVKASGRVCIGTVQGDLHDIGKNLVRMMMEGKGLEVIDLGTDVDSKLDDFMAKVSDDGTINTMKELIDYVADHAPEAAQMAADITSLQELVGATPVNDQIVAAIAKSETKADALFEHVKYEITSKPAEALVNYREKEIRVMCPVDTQFELQNSGENADKSKYYIGFKAYAPAGAVSFKEDLKTTIEDTTMYYFEGNDFAGTDIYGRKYSIVWLPVAKYDEATGTWTYYGKNSSASKYIGWYYSVEWYGADGKVMDSDTIRINLTNEACHNAVEPHYMSGVVKGVSVGGTLLDMIDGKVEVPVGAGLKASEEIEIAEDGTLGIGTINVSKLVTDGTELVLDGGGATN